MSFTLILDPSESLDERLKSQISGQYLSQCVGSLPEGVQVVVVHIKKSADLDEIDLENDPQWQVAREEAWKEYQTKK